MQRSFTCRAKLIRLRTLDGLNGVRQGIPLGTMYRVAPDTVCFMKWGNESAPGKMVARSSIYVGPGDDGSVSGWMPLELLELESNLMSEDLKPFRCSICEQLRERDTNHWWIVRIGVRGDKVELLPWNSVIARRADSVLACGLNCLTTAAGRAADILLFRRGVGIASPQEETQDAT